MVENKQKIEQIAGPVLIGAIVVGCGFVLRPFASAILWAAILCFATWPLYELLLKWLGGRRNLAAVLMTIVLLLVLFIPFLVVGLSFSDNIQSAMEWLNIHKDESLPPPPAWVGRVPLIGTKINAYWLSLMENAEPALNRLRPWLQNAGLWLLRHSIDFAKGVFHLALSVLIAFFLYRDGREVAERLGKVFQQLGGDYARHLIDVVKTTIQGVVYGVIGTALVQGVVAGIGFGIAAVPSPMLLGLLTFFLTFIPFGPMLVWLSASIWLFTEGRTGWGIFMIVYGVIAISSIDNLIKPYIISRGSRLPFIVMLIGMLGGIVTFGFIGVFLGPTLLTVGYSLTKEILGHSRAASVTMPEVKPEHQNSVPSKG